MLLGNSNDRALEQRERGVDGDRNPFFCGRQVLYLFKLPAHQFKACSGRPMSISRVIYDALEASFIILSTHHY